MKILGLEPCPLCITQQFLYCIIGLSAFIAFIHNPKPYKYKFYSGVILVVSAFGSWVAGRQVWLQGLPEDQVPLCGPPLEYILEVFPFADVLNALFMGDGNCAEITWRFLGLSMAGWSLIFFVLFMLLSVLVIFKSYSANR
jgi:disulfide bond formation protein DsbB